MTTFRPGMDLLREVLTVRSLNEVAAAVRSVAELRNRLGPGVFDMAPVAVRCFAASAVAPGTAVVPTGVAADPSACLTASGALSLPVAVRTATTADATTAIWGVALEEGDKDGSVFRAAFHGIAVVRVPRGESGAFLAPDADGSLAFSATATRCRVLCTAAGPVDEGGGDDENDESGGDDESDEGGGDDENDESGVDVVDAIPFDWALVAFADVPAESPCPQWRTSATPPAEDGGKWTISVEGGWAVVTDIALQHGGDSDDGGHSHSHDDTSGDNGPNTHSASGDSESGHNNGTDPGGSDTSIHVPGISYGG